MAQQSSGASLDSLSWQQKVDFFQNLMFYPALTVMVFMRRKVGFRQLKPTRLIGLAFLMLFFGSFASLAQFIPTGIPFLTPISQPLSIGAGAISLYAFAMVVYGLIQRKQRWEDIKRGVVWHTRTTGVSYFESLPYSSYIVHRFVDPLACFAVGFVLHFFLAPLGWWLMFSAVALGIYEQAVYEKALERDLDVLDGLFEAKIHEETAAHFTQGEKSGLSEAPLGLEQTGGIPTGIAPDVRRQIAIRQKRAPLSDTVINTGSVAQPGGFAYSPGEAPAPGSQEAEAVPVVAGVATATTDEAQYAGQEMPSAKLPPDNLAR